MTSSNYTSYIKSPFLKAVIEEEGISCEEKIEKIKGLIEGKKLSLLKSGQIPTSGQTASTSSETSIGNVPGGNVPPVTNNEYDAILSGLNGIKERELGQTILDAINRSDFVNYDKNTHELIIQSEVIKFSNIKNLIAFCVSANAAQIPVGVGLFVEALLHIKAPLSCLRSGDVQILKEDLLRVRALREQDSIGSSVPVAAEGGEVDSGVGGDIADSGVGSGTGVNSEVGSQEAVGSTNETVGEGMISGRGRGRKRKVEFQEEELAPAKRRFDVPESDLSNLRR